VSPLVIAEEEHLNSKMTFLHNTHNLMRVPFFSFPLSLPFIFSFGAIVISPLRVSYIRLPLEERHCLLTVANGPRWMPDKGLMRNWAIRNKRPLPSAIKIYVAWPVTDGKIYHT